MDPRRNPYAPGAGSRPPELAGRDSIIESAAIALDRIRNGLNAQSVILYGLRGVGKTVLLNKIRLDCEDRGFISVSIEAPEAKSLPAILIPALRSALLKLSRLHVAKHWLKIASDHLNGFTRALKIKYNDIEVAFDPKIGLGLADSGDLDYDLTELIKSIGRAALESKTAFVFFIDELQYVEEGQLASLIAALHSANQNQLPITMVAAGLPQILGKMGKAKSYAERLFKFVPVDKLETDAAKSALIIPAKKENINFDAEAIDEILKETQRYPYFLQEWGKHSWDLAVGSSITSADAKQATKLAISELDASFFRVRFDRLTPKEKDYVYAMAELGAGSHRSGDVAEKLGKGVSAVAVVRNSLILKGMVYSPAHGDTAFTVPLFDGFLKRTLSVPVNEIDAI
jgi:hypothetical protein